MSPFFLSASFLVSFTCTMIPLTRSTAATIRPGMGSTLMIINPPMQAPAVAVPAMMKYLSTITAIIPTIRPTIAPTIAPMPQSMPKPSDSVTNMIKNALLEKNRNTPSLYSRLARTQMTTPTMSAPIIANAPIESNCLFVTAIASPRTAPTAAPPTNPCIARIVRNAQYPK